jgi:DNA-binding LacI/PurR family transcriptional regulator
MATLADVARRAEVSKGTVSRVLNNKMNMPISQPTIERIRQAAEELGYRPNALARALATGKTHVIGLFYGNMIDPHFARMLEAVEAKARALGYHLVVSSDLEGFQSEGRMDGLLLVGAPGEPLFAPLPASRPMLFVSPSRGEYLPPNFVTWSDFDGVYQAIQHLTRLGHRHIAGLFGDYIAGEEPPRPRVAGFRRAVEDGEATGYEYYGLLSADQIENGSLLTRRLLRENRQVTALFARNDYLALGALQALHEAGIAVPDRMSLISFGDSVLARGAYPRLTSVHTPFAEAGVLALDHLIERIDGESRDFPGVVLPITLTERDSCAPPPQARQGQ